MVKKIPLKKALQNKKKYHLKKVAFYKTTMI